MTPADLLALAAEIESDTRIAPLARLITCAVLEGRAARMKAAKKGQGMVTETARIEVANKTAPGGVCAPFPEGLTPSKEGLMSESSATTPTCTCFPVADPWTYYGIVEPGGAMEQNPECAIHGDPPRTPRRIQMSRKHPWRADNPDAVIVARPSRWGNGYRVVKEFGVWGVRPPGYACIAPETASLTKAEAAAHAVRFYRHDALAKADEIRAALAGCDVACWCALTDPCHGDPLLEIANAPEGEAS